jgi:hypothetical protein
MRVLPFLFLSLHFALWPAAAAAQQGSLFGQAPPAAPYRAPDGSFGIKLPAAWVPKSWSRERAMAVFQIQTMGDAWLQVIRVPIVDGAQARQLAARGKEFRLSKLPHFTEVGRRDVVFNGVVGASIFGTYWYQGNAQYPRAVEEVYLVVGHEAFEFHFECFEPIAGQLAADVNRVYQSFVPHPPITAPKAETPDSDADYFDKIPF